MIHIAYDIQKAFSKNRVLQNYVYICMECKFGLKIILDFFLEISLFLRHLTDVTYDICDCFIDETIDILNSLRV